MGSIKLITEFSDDVLSIMNDKYCVDRSCEDGSYVEYNNDILSAMASAGYLLGWYVNDTLKGVFWAMQFTYSALQLHINFPLANKGHAVAAGHKLKKWLFENASDNFKVFTALIPECNADVVSFAERNGMTRCGRVKSVFLKNGQLYDYIQFNTMRA